MRLTADDVVDLLGSDMVSPRECFDLGFLFVQVFSDCVM